VRIFSFIFVGCFLVFFFVFVFFFREMSMLFSNYFVPSMTNQQVQLNELLLNSWPFKGTRQIVASSFPIERSNVVIDY